MTTETQAVNFNDDISILPLTEWLDYSAGLDESVFVALPLIQRGSVWKPKQIIDLWDTLLRGMPLGSLMYSPMPAGIGVRKIGEKKMIETPESGAIGLIDGQQRTLAMLIAWQKAGGEMDRRIWVDFADTPGNEHLFRLHVTTKNQPFGFQKAAPDTKLTLSERRKAHLAFEKACSVEEPSQEFLFTNAKPYHSKHPLDLRILIDWWKNHKENTIAWCEQVEKKMSDQFGAETISELIKLRIKNFAKALQRLFKLKIPLLRVDSDIFNSGDGDNSDDNDEKNDPPLAVLFKRIGTGGTELSNADYVYSVIKYHLPESYQLVESLHAAHNIASLLSATNLVMTAIRLATAEYITTDKKPLIDKESPTKQEFHRLIKHAGFLHNGFLPLIQENTLKDAFISLTKLIEYRKTDNSIGLPLYAFPLLSRPLVQVLLRWIRCVQLNKPNDLDAELNKSREEVLRFVMYWRLCVTDPQKASLIAFKQLKETDTYFPGKEIYNVLLKEQVAIPIFSPETIKEIKPDVAFSPDATKKLRGWKRFDTEHATNEVKRIVSLYQRWWGSNSHRYEHSLLLWLQREAVTEFKGSPVAGRGEDTPYDYDHICPANHWSYWTGVSRGDRLIDFLAKEGDSGGHWYVGNSIGNVRVWDSSKNRGDGDKAQNIKLEFDNPVERDKLLKKSAIDPNPLQIEGWRICSGKKGKERSWNEERVQAFQQVVEQRAFTLYERFYNELSFSAWSETLSTVAVTEQE